MPLVAYYDESGTHAGSPCTVLAGFAAQEQEWEHFEREWKKVLRKYSIDHVHAKPLYQRTKAYRGWSEAKFERLLNDLKYVIQERDLFGTKTILFEEDYVKSYQQSFPVAVREKLDSRYGLCVRALLHNLPRLYLSSFKFNPIPDKKSDVINFVMEDGHANAGDARRVYDQLKRASWYRYRRNIGDTLRFAGKLDSCALQAADLLAYTAYGAERDNDKERYAYMSEIEGVLKDSRRGFVTHLIERDDLVALRLNARGREKVQCFERVLIDDSQDVAHAEDGYSLTRRFYPDAY